MEIKPPTLDVVYRCTDCNRNTVMIVNKPADDKPYCQKFNCKGQNLIRLGIAYRGDDDKYRLQPQQSQGDHL